MFGGLRRLASLVQEKLSDVIAHMRTFEYSELRHGKRCERAGSSTAVQG